MGAPGAIVAEMRWTEIRPRLEAGAVAVLPVGASAKEHGPHMPMATDYLTGEALGRLLAERADVLVWPTVGYGHYPAFVGYPGSTSIPRDLFAQTLGHLVADLERAGAKRVLILNTGISTIRGVESVLRPPEVTAVHVYRGQRFGEVHAEVIEQPRGGHADEAETSVMLHLYPDQVDMHAAPTWTQPVAPGRWSHDDPESASYSPPGIFGDATLATAAKGAVLVEAMIEDLLAALV